MPGKIPSTMTFTRLSNAAVTMDTLVTMDSNGAVGPSAVGDDPLGVSLNGASASGAEITVDPGPAVANLTASGLFSADDYVIPAAAGAVKKYLGQAGVTVTVANATDIWTATAHGLTTGEAVRLTNSGGALPAGTDATTTYYVNVIDANTFYLFDTRAHAVAGGATGLVNATGDGTGTHSFRLYGNIFIVGVALEAATTVGQKAAIFQNKRQLILP